MRNYYIIKDGASAGPYTLEQLKSNGIDSDTQIWYEGLTDWIPAKNELELMPLFEVKVFTPPPIPHKPDWGYQVLKVLAALTFLAMIGVAYWKFGMKHQIINPKPDPKEILPKNDSIVIDSVDPIDPRTEYLRAHWPELVTVSVIDADWKTFGGVSDVYVMVKNSMEFDVERLMFEASYILENGEIWKTREYFIQNIPANGSSVPLQIEGSHRGKKIVFKSINIICKGIGIEQELLR